MRNDQINRVLHLLRLMQSGGEYTLVDIYQRVHAYQEVPSDKARRKLFERDLAGIEQVFPITKRRLATRGGTMLYSLAPMGRISAAIEMQQELDADPID